MIAADALMIVTRLVLVEGVRGKVQHTVVERLVSQDLFIRLCLLLGRLTLTLRHEHLVVQIALINLPQIDEAEQQDTCYRIFCLQLAISKQQQEGCTNHNNPECTPAIGSKDSLAHFREIRNQGLDMLCGQ